MSETSMNKKTLSIACITYNHGKYIGQALDGFLMQETDFDFEVVIGEDCSTDNTREILLEYKKKYPDKIKLLLYEKNLGAQANFSQVFKACADSKYFVACDGDDYWTDSLKLQKQVDFLEANPEFSICFHSVEIAYEDGSKSNEISNRNTKEVTTFEDLARGNYIHTLSCVFRNRYSAKSLEWFQNLPVGDFPMHLMNAQHGKIKFVPDVMGVYRVHTGGIWSTNKREETLLKWVEVVKKCRGRFYPRGYAQFSQQLADIYRTLCVNYFAAERYNEFRRFYRRSVPLAKYFDRRIFLALTERYLISYFPKVAAYYGRVRAMAISDAF